MSNPSKQTPIPECTWSRPIGLGWDNPYTVRYRSNLDDGPWHGMPLGGFGAGCIGRSPRGDFNLWHLDGGEHTFQSLPACQFSVFEEAQGKKQAYALCTEAPGEGQLSAWQWYPASQSTTDKGEERTTGRYHALYPRSWFVYNGVFQAELTCEQFSPIWPHKYQECSYPIAIFEWTAYNPTDEPITLSIMLTWQNVVGWFTNAIPPQPSAMSGGLSGVPVTVRDDGSPVYEYKPRWGESEGNFNRFIEDFHRIGCVMTGNRQGEVPEEGEGEWAIATLTNPFMEVFHHTRWNPAGTGEELWDSFARDGSLGDRTDETPADASEQIGVALAIRFTIRPGKTRKIPFILAWDLPVTEFAPNVWYYRRYTDFFGRSGNNSWTMVRTALKHLNMWRDNILAWQQPILSREDLPDSIKVALFNELYILSAGGSLWTAQDELDARGKFAVLECLDYRWYESLDVRLYGSFALLMLWPQLEKSVMLAFARAIPTSDPTHRTIGYNQADAVRKVADATPHDLGAPNEHPWHKTNYTSYQDCNLWKDLPSDFVLQVYRDFLLTGAQDYEFLWDCWPSVVRTLGYLQQFDNDGDGIPENGGAPDQTFDDWQLKGVSAYCGGLWIAALSAAIAIGEVLLENPPHSGIFTGTIYESERSDLLDTTAIEETLATYRDWLARSRKVYHETLWNGKYYRLDSESGSDVVMADQLCGQFYARLLGLEDIVPSECTLSTLDAIFEACFLKFHGGKFGAANGVLPDGSAANPEATHPLEVWTGINFGLAAFLLQMGKKNEAFQLAQTVIDRLYENGLQFRTPEAITAAGTFRASHYLRAMAIWALYGVLTEFKDT